MDLYAEEVFGPVAALFTVADLDEAIEIANSHPYGLGLQPVERGRGRAGPVRPRHRLGHGVHQRDGRPAIPELPFGGVKQSGYGRELTELGMREFMNAKTVWVGAPGGGESTGTSAGGHAE